MIFLTVHIYLQLKIDNFYVLYSLDYSTRNLDLLDF
jgi:hypothetical protein